MGPTQDPFEPLYFLFSALVDKLNNFTDSLPYFINLLTQALWLGFGVGLFIYARRALSRRSRTERRRISQNRNGLGEIVNKSRVGIAADLFHISIAILLIAILAILWPQPQTPRGLVFVLTINSVFLFMGYKCFHAARSLDKSDMDAARWIRKNIPHMQVDSILDEEED